MKALPDISEWNIESLRFTIFVDGKCSFESWWSDWVGIQPEQMQQNYQTGDLSQFGPYKSGILELKVSLGRIDWNLSPIVGPGIDFPKLGEFDESVPSFLQDATAWLSRSGIAVRRMALGVTAILPVKNMQDGYEMMSVLLPFIPFGGDWSDFSFQLNKRCNSKSIDGLTINRLARWSVVEFVSVMQAPGMNLKQKSSTACRMEMDFNSADGHPVPEGLSSELAIELSQKARNLVLLGARQ